MIDWKRLDINKPPKGKLLLYRPDTDSIEYTKFLFQWYGHPELAYTHWAIADKPRSSK